MNRFFVFLAFLGFSSFLSAREKPIVEVRFAYLRPSSELLRDTYGNGGIDYQLTGTFPVFCGVNLWGAVDFFYTNGTSNAGTKTKFHMVPLTFGLKYMAPYFDPIIPYLGLGGRYYLTQAISNNPYDLKSISQNGFGGVVEGGLLYFFCDHFAADLFASYGFTTLGPPSLTQSNLIPESLNLCALTIGGGIAYRF